MTDPSTVVRTDGGEDDLADDLEQVVEEARELADDIDVSDLGEAIDVESLPETVDVGGLSEAIEEGDPSKVVRFGKLLQIVDLGDLWDEVDVVSLWRNQRELKEALEDVFGEDFLEDDGDGDEADGPLDRAVETAEETAEKASQEMAETGQEMAKAGENPAGVDSRTYQLSIQREVSDAIEEFREKLIETRGELAELHEANRERTDSVGQPESRNPTAHSTLAGHRGPPKGLAQHSTVPRETKYSTAPNFDRIYGDRFERELEKRRKRGGDDE